MLKQLCNAVEETGKLRKIISQIDFERIYADSSKAAQAQLNFLDKSGKLAELQHDLLELMKEV